MNNLATTPEEQGLRDTDVLFRQLMENINEVFWITDLRKNQMIYISPGYEHVWGRTCQSLYDSPRQWMDAIHPDDRARIQEAAVNKQPRGTYDEEYRIVRPDGSIRWIRDRAFTVADEGGDTYRIAGIAEDMTAVKLANQEVARLAAIVESSDNGIIGQDLNGIINTWNKGARKMYGYSPDEVIGKSIDILAPPEGFDFSSINERLGRGESIHSIETRQTRKDGSQVCVSLTISPVRDAAGIITGASAIAHDISEQVRLEKEVLEAGELRALPHRTGPARFGLSVAHGDFVYVQVTGREDQGQGPFGIGRPGTNSSSAARCQQADARGGAGAVPNGTAGERPGTGAGRACGHH